MRKILKKRKYSEHPGDWYLWIVLCQIKPHPDSEYVTWIYNSEDNAYYSGHYFKDISMANSDYEQRNR